LASSVRPGGPAGGGCGAAVGGRRLAGQAGHLAGVVRDVPALRQVEQDKGIAKRVSNDRDMTDGNIERLGEDPADWTARAASSADATSQFGV
jgi:hypothetical protein